MIHRDERENEAITMVGIEELESWGDELKVLRTRLSQRFVRSEPRERAISYLKGLMSDVPRKNGWQLAEQAGEATPDGMERLLSTAVWDVTGVRDELQGWVVERLGDAEGVLVLDETGFLKKGTKSVGVKRQYSGTAGRIENCQVGVFLGYATGKGYTLLDREVYLPQEWAADAARRREAQIPDAVTFATQPALGQRMLERAVAVGVPFRWVTGDTVYGSDRNLRRWLEEQGHCFVLGVKEDEPLWQGFAQVRAKALLAQVPPEAWQRLSCGAGAKGERVYDWALVSLPRFLQSPDILHALLFRRRLGDPTQIDYYVVFAPADVTLQTLVTVAGQRWTIEECIELAKNEVGLDHYEVRHWIGWYRHITLAMLALAYLTITRLDARLVEQKKRP
jgi:SRSO17 transposase